MGRIRYGGTLVSVICLGGYILLSLSGLSVPAGVLETVTGFAVLSCHIGRKVYDSSFSPGLYTMQEEANSMFDRLVTADIRDLSTLQQHLGTIDHLTRVERRYGDLIEQLHTLLLGMQGENPLSFRAVQEGVEQLLTAESRARRESSARVMLDLHQDIAHLAEVATGAVEVPQEGEESIGPPHAEESGDGVLPEDGNVMH